MILTVCLSPSTDVTVELDSLSVGKTNVVKSKTLSFTGKALNVAIGVARLGGNPYATGFMYNENGYMFENALDKEGVPFTFVWNKGRVRENYKFIDKKSMLTEVNDVGEEVGEEKTRELLGVLAPLSARSSATVISGSLPKGVSADYYESLFKAADQNSIRIADASGDKLLAALRAGVDLIKPNLDEIQSTLGREFLDKDDLLTGCRELLDKGAKTVLVSLGKKGAVITNGSRHFYCKSMNVAVNSTVGAGDAMVAAAAMQAVQSAPMEEILRASVAAGTARVTTVGQISFTKEKYEEVYKSLTVKEIF